MVKVGSTVTWINSAGKRTGEVKSIQPGKVIVRSKKGVEYEVKDITKLMVRE